MSDLHSQNKGSWGHLHPYWVKPSGSGYTSLFRTYDRFSFLMHSSRFDCNNLFFQHQKITSVWHTPWEYASCFKLSFLQLNHKLMTKSIFKGSSYDIKCFVEHNVLNKSNPPILNSHWVTSVETQKWHFY